MPWTLNRNSSCGLKRMSQSLQTRYLLSKVCDFSPTCAVLSDIAIGFDPTQDSPIEILHTILLAQGSATFSPWVMGVAIWQNAHGSWAIQLLYNALYNLWPMEVRTTVQPMANGKKKISKGDGLYNYIVGPCLWIMGCATEHRVHISHESWIVQQYIVLIDHGLYNNISFSWTMDCTMVMLIHIPHALWVVQ